jgi:hypothetical protein
VAARYKSAKPALVIFNRGPGSFLRELSHPEGPRRSLPREASHP